MTIHTRSLKWLYQFTLQAFLVSVVALGLPGTAAADEVTVDCDGPGPADFGSISAALAALSPAGPNLISVLPGTCAENIEISEQAGPEIVAGVIVPGRAQITALIMEQESCGSA